MNEIYILGLDGLEFDFVRKWNLKNLKQIEYDRIIVPINKEKGVPMSPQVWGSFLTGKNEVQDFQYQASPLNILSVFLSYIKKYLKITNFINIAQKIIPDRFWTRQVIGFTKLQNKTFLDLTKSKPINVIYYNQDQTGNLLYFYFSIGEISLEKTVKLANSLYIKTKKQILNETKKFLDSYELIFSYLHFPDLLQHLLMFKPEEIKNLYLNLDEFVLSLKRLMPDHTLFLIISDHGFDLKIGYHSNFGFYSCNKPLIPKPKHITDFFQIIMDKIGEKKNNK
ncbi:MAG: hypothetical protein ACFFDN_03695 [Candidatus Hodarchaeota archaeon]